MATKRASPGKKTAGRKAAAPAPASELTETAVTVVLESAEAPVASATLDPDRRRQLVAAEAYFLAERRGFAAGHELEDWAAAEAVVDSRLKRQQVA